MGNTLQFVVGGNAENLHLTLDVAANKQYLRSYSPTNKKIILGSMVSNKEHIKFSTYCTLG